MKPCSALVCVVFLVSIVNAAKLGVYNYKYLRRLAQEMREFSCPVGFISIQGSSSCYLIEDIESYTWNQARDQCAQAAEFSRLVRFETSEEQNAMIRTLTGEVSEVWEQRYWTAGVRVRGTNDFQWAEGQPLNPSQWRSDEPNGLADGEDYVDLFYTPRNEWGLNDERGTATAGYICERDPTASTDEQTVECTSGFTALSSAFSSCYYAVHQQAYSASKAATKCDQYGANVQLVTLDTVEEAQALYVWLESGLRSQRLWDPSGVRRYWTGAYKDWITEEFRWSEDVPFDPALWRDGEPNGRRGIEDAVDLLYKFGVWGANDEAGGVDAGYVCEMVADQRGEVDQGGDAMDRGDFSPRVSVRLVDGDSTSSGRVEVYHNGQWGTVCDDLWDNTNARVVCRSLGFSDGTAYLRAHFGAGEGEIWLDEVRCTGRERSIFDCPAKPIGEDDCYHNEDASVICS